MSSRRQARSIGDVISKHRIFTLPPSATVRVAAREMAKQKIGSIMIVEQDRLVGIFTERDALFRVLSAGVDPDATPLSAVMTRNPTTISADRPLTDALHMMHDNGFRHVPVVKNGLPVGMVSIRDALGSELMHFEHEVEEKEALMEIVG